MVRTVRSYFHQEWRGVGGEWGIGQGYRSPGGACIWKGFTPFLTKHG